MVSHIGLIFRNDAAQARIDTALDAIAASGAIDMPPMPEKTRDMQHNNTLRMEWLADALEAVAAQAAPTSRPTKAKAQP